MTTITINRRTALLGTVTLPAAMAPLGIANAASRSASTAEPANATDAAWAELQDAEAAWEAHKAAEDAFDATLPEHLRRRPSMLDFDFDRAAFEEGVAVWDAERAAYPANPYETTDDVLDAFCGRVNAAQDAILETPAATMTDLERKLIVAETAIGDNGNSDANAGVVRGLLADVRRLDGRAA